ncbi:hypothetical protein SAMN02745134_01233 [Clostridium acidisoli DSM 12555]|uniref:Uncharacterized protein n=2 Tax=Clostridium TaxID=1485 RepID=A0A1W1XBH0_9CLOT|nr:hypothetical protein SAMN02745134_01233 [Clostridium acidisoli DSM 12555]
MNMNDEVLNKQSKVSCEIKVFKELFIKQWWEESNELPDIGNASGYWHKRTKEKQTNQFVNQFVINIKEFPKEQSYRKEWKKNFKVVIDNFIKETELITIKEKEILLSNELIESTEKFISKARKFNPNLSFEELGQAMRNLWIVNIIQMLLGRTPKLTSSTYGYSMLYPYTDNFLDSKVISRDDKTKINKNFALKLAGKKTIAKNEYEENLFKLVNNIEEEYNREQYPNVFDSLLCIHSAQIKSLAQQNKAVTPYESDILGISFEKGGTSVLADAYLVNGELTEQQAKFFFGYGVLLQLCDDLQDVQEDLENGSVTMFSMLANTWNFDNVTNKLINFTVDLLESMPMDNMIVIKDLIEKNCIQLILFAIAKNKKLYSKTYIKKVEKYFPYRSRYMSNELKKIKKQFSKVKESYNGVSTEQIIMYALKNDK